MSSTAMRLLRKISSGRLDTEKDKPKEKKVDTPPEKVTKEKKIQSIPETNEEEKKIQTIPEKPVKKEKKSSSSSEKKTKEKKIDPTPGKATKEKKIEVAPDMVTPEKKKKVKKTSSSQNLSSEKKLSSRRSSTDSMGSFSDQTASGKSLLKPTSERKLSRNSSAASLKKKASYRPIEEETEEVLDIASSLLKRQTSSALLPSIERKSFESIDSDDLLIVNPGVHVASNPKNVEKMTWTPKTSPAIKKQIGSVDKEALLVAPYTPPPLHDNGLIAQYANALGLDRQAFLDLKEEKPLSEGSDGKKLYSYRELLRRNYNKDYGDLIQTELEMYLVDDAFVLVFGMNKDEFAKIAKWKRTQLKKNSMLF